MDMDKIKKSEKGVLKNILNQVQSNARTVTGRNLRSSLLLTDKSSIDQLHQQEIDQVNYYGEPERWRVVSILEALQMRAGELELPLDWEMEEMEEILEAACCS